MYEKLQLFFSRTLTIAQTWVADKKNPTGSEQRKKSGARGKKGTILLDDVPKETITLSYSWISKPSPPLTECVPVRVERERATHTLA